MVVGYQGNGTLSVTNGGQVNLYGGDGAGNALKIGQIANSTGSVTVDGIGSQLNISPDPNLLVGIDGAGSLTVTNGGLVSTSYLYLATGGGSGNVSITNGGTIEVSNSDGIVAGSANYSFNLDGGTLAVGSSDLTTNIAITLSDDFPQDNVFNTGRYSMTLTGGPFSIARNEILCPISIVSRANKSPVPSNCCGRTSPRAGPRA